ncbi:uncharacterized protein BXIN_2467 [Babesia sp. Xinjiang]|uniref:uncharacterized protein n=1 Tax=Babesia sp. Xinjiang TaxID=462227 RepID=UPI000A2505F0|nr:uncharacterized protein BXIN_2467 [Babesia sp. Xinjiang]ORM41495.1 hypothetical protein BXIN_2467 [Babesia sp. Xinjiang]
MRHIAAILLLDITIICYVVLYAVSVSSRGGTAFLSGAVPPALCKPLPQLYARHIDFLEDPLESIPHIEYSSSKYPPYPYYDAPRNLFFATYSQEDKASDDSGTAVSEAQSTYMKNAELRRTGEKVAPLDSSPIAAFDRAIGNDYRDYIYTPGVQHEREVMRTDLAEYDLVRPGIAPWPSYEELRAEGLALRTSLFIDLDPGHQLERHLIGKPMHRNDIATLGEARIEQRRWVERSYNEEWPLTYDEFAALPLDMREAYYANRYPVCDEDERFSMVLNYRRAIGCPVEKEHPLEFRYQEDSYTYTPRDSPVLRDLMNWDDPLDAPWRIRVEECIRDCVAYGWPPESIRFHTCFEVYDVTWLAGAVKVVIEQTRDEGGFITPMELKLMLSKLERRLKDLDEDEGTQSIASHSLILVAREHTRSAGKVLICRRDWNSHVGSNVTIYFTDPDAPVIRGIMRGSHSTLALKIEVDGREQTLPLNFIREIRLT